MRSKIKYFGEATALAKRMIEASRKSEYTFMISQLCRSYEFNFRPVMGSTSRIIEPSEDDWTRAMEIPWEEN